MVKEMSFLVKIKSGKRFPPKIKICPAGHSSSLDAKITINSKDYSREKLWRKLEAQMDLFLEELYLK